MKKKFILFLIGFMSLLAEADEGYLSPSGYSGLGIIPSAGTIDTGLAVFGNGNTIPGALNARGNSTQVGIGLYNGIEVVGRLASNDDRCNMFLLGQCPANTIRDFSSSVKWSLPIEWLNERNAKVAVGVSDVGGAANYFRSNYWIASKEFGENLLVSAGAGQKIGANALLDGPMASIYWNSSWVKAGIEQVNRTATAHVGLSMQIPKTELTGWMTINQRLSDAATTNRSWLSYGVSIPLDGTSKLKKSNRSVTVQSRLIHPIELNQFEPLLEKNGFFNSKFGETAKGVKVVEIENTGYAWNILDAAGVALGAVAAVYGETEQKFELIVKARGIRQLLVKGDASCLKRMYQTEADCALQLESFAQGRAENYVSRDVTWQDTRDWWQYIRPELVLSPVVSTPIGTEYSSFDMDLGANVGIITPLWRGAVLDMNRIEPLNINTRGFDQDGAFYGGRIKPAVTRRMIHQFASFEDIKTQTRLSYGTTYSNWDGYQLETSTQNDNGRHRAGIIAGRFKSDLSNVVKDYSQLHYRYAWRDDQSITSEINVGEFWGGDKGYLASQKFWFGDANISIYIKQSKLPTDTKEFSFAGMQLSLPITPRENSGFEHFTVRGTSQWSYALESRILEKENLITVGYAEIPRVGESLLQTQNRDRNSTEYFMTNQWRLKDAFVKLYKD